MSSSSLSAKPIKTCYVSFMFICDIHIELFFPFPPISTTTVIWNSPKVYKNYVISIRIYCLVFIISCAVHTERHHNVCIFSQKKIPLIYAHLEPYKWVSFYIRASQNRNTEPKCRGNIWCNSFWNLTINLKNPCIQKLGSSYFSIFDHL